MLTFTNTSDAEVHEMVVVRIPDEETRPVAELAQLPPEESFAIFAELDAGDGQRRRRPARRAWPSSATARITEPGRYIIACAIPIGADPAGGRRVADADRVERAAGPRRRARRTSPPACTAS